MTPEDPNRPDTQGLPTAAEAGEATGSLTGISGLFGLDQSKTPTPARDRPRLASQTGGFTAPGSTPTSLYVPLADDATPKTLQGRYRLIAQLGMGGMGVTYRAWDSQDGVPVVIKMPRRDVRSNPEIMDRFTREVRTMLELSHEHIVPITDHGEDEGCPFVAMRFLPGGSLSEYRGRNEDGTAATLPPGTLHSWLPGIAKALDFIHSSGVLHRDVKPGNIFLDGFLKPFLGDFGIAKIVDETAGLNREYTLTATRMAVGTPEYMAPELFRPGGTPDGRVDQYALAVTVYEMLAGRKPFRGDSAHIIVEHASKDAPGLQDFCPDVPRRLAEAVHRALAKNPDDRFATCSQFAEAVLAQAATLEIDTSRARLLCPSCRAILRVSKSTAGKRGTCPKCQSPVRVAEDLCSLWLTGEDRSPLNDEAVGDGQSSMTWTAEAAGTNSGKHVQTTMSGAAPTEPGATPGRPSWITAAIVGAIVGLVVGLLAGLAIPRRPQYIIGAGKLVGPVLQQRAATTKSDTDTRPNYGELPPEAIEALTNGTGYELQLGSLESLSVTAAKALAKYRGYRLSLDGLKTLYPEVATALAAYRGQLSLNGLKRLSPAAEAALANHEGGLYLEGLTSLQSVDLATALRKNTSTLEFPDLSVIPPETARALVAEFHNGYYPRVLIGDLRQPSAEILAALAKGCVTLPGVQTLAESAAAALTDDDPASQLFLPAIKSLSPAAAAELAKRRGRVTLGLKTLSTETALALAAGPARIRLPSLTSCPPEGLRALKAMPDLLVIPPALNTPLERFLWCLTGWFKYVVLAILAVAAALIPTSILFVRRIAMDDDESINAVYGDGIKRALVPAVIAISLLAGLTTFLGLKILPMHRKYWNDLGQEPPAVAYGGLDLTLFGLLVAGLGCLAYASFVRKRLKKSLHPIWSMRLYPTAFSRFGDYAVCGMWLLLACVTAAEFLIGNRQGFRYGSGTYEGGTFVWWWTSFLISHGGMLVLPAVTLRSFLPSARRAFWPALAECRAYREGIVNASDRFFDWDRLRAYSWKPDHLELTMPPEKATGAALVNNADMFMIGGVLRGVVPQQQREMVEAFLAERLAKANRKR